MFKYSILLFLLFALNVEAQNCAPIDKVPDLNCDGSAVISIIGDSLVFGVGDSVNKNSGGYVKRLQDRLKNVSVNNFGKKGMFAADLPKLLTNAFKAPLNELGQTLLISDLVVLDVGRNDRWFFKTPDATYRNLQRAVSIIRAKVTQKTGRAPHVATSVLMLPNRGSQGPWVKELNRLIRAGNGKAGQPELRFDLVSKRLLAPDQIHPTSKGYKELELVLYRYLTVALPKFAAISN